MGTDTTTPPQLDAAAPADRAPAAPTARTIRVERVLPAPADRVWRAMQQPGTFLYVARGVLGFPALAGRTDPFVEGEEGVGWLWLFHVLPTSRHHIHLVEVDTGTRTMRTEEHGGLLRRWDHTLHVEPVDDRHSRYSDVVVIDAGPLTRVVVPVARGLFRYRQLRWRRLARRHLGTGAALRK